MEEMENLTFSLCFGHEIVPSPVSLPAPCYIADCYAERGRNIYNANVQANGQLNSADLQELTDHLNYSSKVIRNQRFNA